MMVQKFHVFGCLVVLLLGALGDYMEIYKLPNWFFILFGGALALFLQHKLQWNLNSSTTSAISNETAAAQQELKIIRADETLLKKRMVCFLNTFSH